jgi:hypothetical protein
MTSLTIQQQLLVLLSQTPGLTPREITAALPQFTDGAVRQGIYRTKQAKLIETHANARYSLTDLGQQHVGNVQDTSELSTPLPSTQPRDTYSLLKDIHQLRRKHGKVVFDEAYEAVRGIDP